MAATQGIEPQSDGLEPPVLPLNYEAAVKTVLSDLLVGATRGACIPLSALQVQRITINACIAWSGNRDSNPDSLLGRQLKTILPRFVSCWCGQFSKLAPTCPKLLLDTAYTVYTIIGYLTSFTQALLPVTPHTNKLCRLLASVQLDTRPHQRDVAHE